MMHIEKENLLNSLDKIKDIDILIVGDTILDEYQYGNTLGKSGKNPIVAFKNDYIERYDGGVLAIYNHLKELSSVEYLTGDECIIKKRYIQETQKLFETYTHIQNPFKSTISKNISDYDLVIIADFGHGFINRELRGRIESESKYIALNTQLNAGNLGLNTINKYKNRNYISIDGLELRLAVSNSEDSVESILRNTFHHETVSITSGKDGSIIYRNGNLIRISSFIDIIVP